MVFLIVSFVKVIRFFEIFSNYGYFLIKKEVKGLL